MLLGPQTTVLTGPQGSSRTRVAPPSATVGANSQAAAGQPLVVVGSVNADLVLSIQRLPQPGETLAASDLQFFPGGKGANQAAAAAKLQCPTFFLGQVGSDSYAAPLRAALTAAGVQLDLLRTVEGPSGTAVILLQAGSGADGSLDAVWPGSSIPSHPRRCPAPAGENSIIIVGGANQDLAAWQMSEAAQQLICRAGAVLLQREIPESVNLRVAQVAAAAGVPVLLDAGGVDAPIADELLQQLAIISPNETELQRLTGMPTENDEQLLAAAAALQARAGPGLQVLLKLGTAGSMLVSAGGDAIKQPAVRAPQVVDTTGAGDCFTAAFMVGLLEGLPPASALKFAAAAASICVSRPGAMPSLPSRVELDACLKSLA